MDSYSVNFKPSVQKDLRPLPKALVARVMERIEGLKTDPFPRQAIKLSSTERLYRLRVGDYRIVYESVVPGGARRGRETFIAVLCVCSGVYLRYWRLRAIRPCASIRWRELLKCPEAARRHGR